ncbi:hypothetical protein E2320_013894 [Naja naja]|nr:hypothetical protein E2320_013894 [Naja naja]
MSSPAVTPELDMKDVELNEMDPEKQPMNASSPLAGSPGSLGEKNGVVKVKMEEEEEEGEMVAKFTGLSKEQLLQVAGTPGWVRTRWVLLIVFWLGWLGMLAGAIAIIVQAPRCKDLPKQDWWQKGGIYRILEVERFQDSGSDGIGDLTGVKERMNYLSTLKVKGFVIGPLHVNPEDQPYSTNLQDVDQKLGTLQDFRDVLQAAKKKNIKVILDLTPNYHGELPWFSRDVWLQGDFQNKMKEAIQFWLREGVSGIQIGSVEDLNMGRPYLGHLAKSMGEQLLRLHHLLFYTLPGTPFTDFGDEIGLWDMPGEAQQGHKGSILSFFQELSELRTKERSLLHGDFALVQSLNPSVFSYLRVWDQNKRFLVVLNFAHQERTISLLHSHLPAQVDVELSTHPSREEKQLDLQNLKLLPSEGLLLSFPYVAL